MRDLRHEELSRIAQEVVRYISKRSYISQYIPFGDGNIVEITEELNALLDKLDELSQPPF